MLPPLIRRKRAPHPTRPWLVALLLGFALLAGLYAQTRLLVQDTTSTAKPSVVDEPAGNALVETAPPQPEPQTVHVPTLVVTAWFNLERAFGPTTTVQRRQRESYKPWLERYFLFFNRTTILVYTDDVEALKPFLTSNPNVYAVVAPLSSHACFAELIDYFWFWQGLEYKATKARPELLALWACKPMFVREAIEMANAMLRFDPAVRAWRPATAWLAASYYLWTDIGSVREDFYLTNVGEEGSDEADEASEVVPNLETVAEEVALDRILMSSSGHNREPSCSSMNYDYTLEEVARLPKATRAVDLGNQPDFIAGAIFGGSRRAQLAYAALFYRYAHEYLAPPEQVRGLASRNETLAVVRALYRTRALRRRALNDQHLMGTVACLHPELVRVLRAEGEDSWYELHERFSETPSARAEREEETRMELLQEKLEELAELQEPGGSDDLPLPSLPIESWVATSYWFSEDAEDEAMEVFLQSVSHSHVVVLTDSLEALARLGVRSRRLYAMPVPLAPLGPCLELGAQLRRRNTTEGTPTLEHCRPTLMKLVADDSLPLYVYDQGETKGEGHFRLARARLRAAYVVWLDGGAALAGGGGWPARAAVREEVPKHRVLMSTAGKNLYPSCSTMNFLSPPTQAESAARGPPADRAEPVVLDAMLAGTPCALVEYHRAYAGQAARLLRTRRDLEVGVSDVMEAVACARPDLVRVHRATKSVDSTRALAEFRDYFRDEAARRRRAARGEDSSGLEDVGQ